VEDVVFFLMSEIFKKVVLAVIGISGGELDQDKRTVDFLQDPRQALRYTTRRSQMVICVKGVGACVDGHDT
jgi:hypothetical protein